MFQRTENPPYLSAILNGEKWSDSFCEGKHFLSPKLDCTLGHTIELEHGCQVELISRYLKAQLQEIVIQIHRIAQFLEAQTQISLLEVRYQQMEALMKSYAESADSPDHGKSYEKNIPTKIRLDGRTSKDTSCTDPVQNSNSFQSGICSVYCGLNSLNYIKEEHIKQTPLPDVDVPTQIFQISNTEEELSIQKSYRKHVQVEMCLAYRKRPSFLYDCIEVNVAAVIMDCWFYEQNHLELKMLNSALKMVLYERTAHGTKYQNTSSCQRHPGICSAESSEVSCRLDENVHIEQVFHNDHENAVEKIRIEETNCIPKKKTVKAKCETGVSKENITKKGTSNRGIYKKRSWRMFELVNVWLILQAFLSSVCGAPHPTEPNGLNKETVQRKQLLLTTDCNHGNLYDLNQYCQTDSFLLKLLIGNCHFKALCSSEEEPICINTQNKGVFVCEKKNLKCAKGHMIRAWTDENNPDIINLQEQICPEGTFQPQTLDCQYACYYNHRNIDQISEKYIVYSQGDNISPTMVYCNNTGGFFSQKEGTFLLDYDLEEEHNRYFCVKKNRSQLCKMDQYPLPNNTCTELCRDGYFRDDHDNFNCKPIEDRLSPGSSFATEVTDGNIHKELTINAAAEKKQSNSLAVTLTPVYCKRGEQFRQYFARNIQTKGTNTTTLYGIHSQEPHTGEDDGTNDLEDVVNEDVIDHENNRIGIEDSDCGMPLLIKV
ncbi:uncharacterized protein LOC128552851 isoform X2 [Mercenaria mercenaria]|uniref:uncharacterized protein LOC128552851 isoform X2 n=1 Tax=Mercenaria mercenaria TaxID=6596 RepID=UPI00234F09D5|nr:uncharacterized protein LOC128552851 isoform X2 [Mercenaria mercenaria]